MAPTVTLLGNPVELHGELPEVGAAAPDFTALSTEMKPVALSGFRGKVVLVASLGSLDTPTCDAETRRFNVEASALGEDVEVLTVSMDLPFAQARWCGAAGIERIQTLSDHRDASFGRAYGVLVPATRLLARALFVIDRDGVVRYTQLVPEIADEPDYAAALAALAELV